MRPSASNLSLAILLCATWAGNYFVIGDLLAYVDPFTLSFLRAILGALFVLAIGGYKMKGIRRSDLPWIAMIGVFNIALFLILLNTSLLTAQPGVDSTLVYTQPILVVALAPLVGERLTRLKLLGILVAFAGVVTVFIPSIIGAKLVVGDLYALGASLSWATAVILFKRWRPTADVFGITAAQLLFAAAFTLPVLPFENTFLHAVPAFWPLLAYNVLAATGFGYVAYYKVLATMPSTQFSSYFFLVPVFTTIMGSIFNLSLPAVNEALGTAMVAVGIILVNR